MAIMSVCWVAGGTRYGLYWHRGHIMNDCEIMLFNHQHKKAGPKRSSDYINFSMSSDYINFSMKPSGRHRFPLCLAHSLGWWPVFWCIRCCCACCPLLMHSTHTTGNGLASGVWWASVCCCWQPGSDWPAVCLKQSDGSQKGVVWGKMHIYPVY